MKIWKTIPSEQDYEASTDGQIRNKKTGRVIRQVNCVGYLKICIKNKTKLVHRLVAETFLEKNDFNIVHHKDNDKRNNNVENLEWTTQSYNVKKAYIDNLYKKDRKGLNNPNYKNGKYIKSKK